MQVIQILHSICRKDGTMDVLYLNGVAVAPSKLDIAKNKLWSEGSGRVTNGDWNGDIKARKYKFEIEVSALSQSECATILNAVDGDNVKYFTVKFIDPYSTTGAWKTVTCYCSDTTASVYNYTRNNVRYSNIRFSTIGR